MYNIQMELKHFLEITDLTPAEISNVLELSGSDSYSKILDSKTAALLFEKPSLRTRHSVEAAVVELGGHPIYTRPEEIQFGGRESIGDIAKTMSQYHSFIAARVFEHEVLEEMASHSSVPVINLLSNDTHPIQTLADLLTIKNHFGKIEGLKIVFVGDPNNVALPLGIAATELGANFVVSHPDSYDFNEYAQKLFANTGIELESNIGPHNAVKNADVIYTDAWYSMGQEDEQLKRYQDFSKYQVNAELMSLANDSAVFMHCLPAHRGSEVTDEVIDSAQSIVFQQAQNRQHSTRGLLLHLLG